MAADTADVIVVGAGPTGLLVAGDLAAAGLRTTLLERRREESRLTRAFAVHARTLELLDARGLADELIGTGQVVDSLRLFGRFSVDLSGLPSRFPFLLVTPQYQTERLLRGRAAAGGAELVGGAEVVGVRQDRAGVQVEVRDTGGTHTCRAGYLVGADGVRSTVRDAIGESFPGRSLGQSVMLADVRLAEPPADVFSVNATANGFAFMVPFGDGWYRVIAFRQGEQLPDTAPVELDDIREVTRTVLGTDHGMHDPRWMSRFHNDERQAPRYRVGRAFLAGDAAHVHSPAGGQGMNAGLQDAANLSWKLALAATGRVGDPLLDSYHAERHPAGQQVLRLSAGLLRAATVRAAPLRGVRRLLGTAVTTVGPVTDAAARRIAGLDIAYPAGPGAHRAAGRRVPDLQLTGPARPGAPTRLYEALRSGRFQLVSADGGPPASAGRWADRVDTATTPVVAPRLALVRPDGYAAWATDATDPAARDTAARAALDQWCGAPG
ncbi:MAG TPA: FAD-dependent monooxygenase [Mycobacteriales bacterium]|nr:FAD-dependent monooxygenase [Mycobacteriales bacterium]